MYYTTTLPSPVGELTLACDDSALTGLWLSGQKYHSDTLPENVGRGDNAPVLISAAKWLKSYFAAENPPIDAIPLRPSGSDFRRGVWDILCKIPYGEVITYADIAKKMAAKMNIQSMSAQAVGGAVGHNPISIIIPCHRVVGTNGSLTGYAGGIAAKVSLLTLEGANMSSLFIPKNSTAL